MSLKLAEIQFRERPRAELRAHLCSLGHIPPQCVDEIVDIACHAADCARRAMLETIDRATSLPARVTALGLATSLTAHDAQFLQEAMKAFAKEAGLKTHEGKIEVRNG